MHLLPPAHLRASLGTGPLATEPPGHAVMQQGQAGVTGWAPGPGQCWGSHTVAVLSTALHGSWCPRLPVEEAEVQGRWEVRERVRKRQSGLTPGFSGAADSGRDVVWPSGRPQTTGGMWSWPGQV